MQLTVSVLVENRAENNGCVAEHGLSLFVETPGHHCLFDTGASNIFARNASKLEMELFGADSIVLSHGHYDHGGGTAKALREASNPILYLHSDSLLPCYSARNGRKKYIGFPDSSMRAIEEADEMGCLVRVEGEDVRISDNLRILSSSEIAEANPHSDFFREYSDGEIFHDDFSHEIFLLAEGRSSACLFAGCCHAGILKIIGLASRKSRKPLKYIFGGIHTESTSPRELEEISASFAKSGISFFLGHCTGQIPFAKIYALLGNRLNPLHTGANFTIDI